MRSIDMLIQEHAAMDAVAADLLAITAQPEPNVARAYDALHSLGRCIDNDFAIQDSFLYTDASRLEKTPLEKQVGSFDPILADVKAEWMIYAAEWNEENIGIDWQTFGRDTLQIVTLLRERISERNEVLYPLALQENRIRLRSAA